MSIPESPRPRGPRLRSGGAFLLIALILLQIVATRSASLFRKGLWLDEYHTLLIAEDPSLGHAMDALRHGADVNAPGLYLLARAVSRCTGATGLPLVRGIAFASILAGLVGLYTAIRKVYTPGIALIAASAAWAHPTAVHHAFEGRYYGPWFAGIVWFAIALNHWDRSRSKLGPGLLVGATAVWVCTIHYFGIFSLILVTAAHSSVVRGSWREVVLRLVPVGAGPVALAACLPFYFGQKRSLTVPTWIDPPDYNGVLKYLDSVFPCYLLLIPVFAFFATVLWGRRGLALGDGPEAGREDLAELAGLASLAFLPLILILFSFLVQSVLIDRYAIPTVAAIAVVIAPLLARTGPRLRLVALLGLIAFSSGRLVAQSRLYRGVDASRLAMAGEAARLPVADAPILVKSRERLYELWWDVPSLRPRLFLWSPDDQGDRATDLLRIERDMARNHERWYGVARVGDLGLLRDRPVIYLSGLVPGDLLGLARERPDLDLRPINPDRGLYEVSRKTGHEPPAP